MGHIGSQDGFFEKVAVFAVGCCAFSMTMSADAAAAAATAGTSIAAILGAAAFKATLGHRSECDAAVQRVKKILPKAFRVANDVDERVVGDVIERLESIIELDELLSINSLQAAISKDENIIAGLVSVALDSIATADATFASPGAARDLAEDLFSAAFEAAWQACEEFRDKTSRVVQETTLAEVRNYGEHQHALLTKILASLGTETAISRSVASAANRSREVTVDSYESKLDPSWESFVLQVLTQATIDQLRAIYPSNTNFEAEFKRVYKAISTTEFRIPQAWLGNLNKAVSKPILDELGTLSRPEHLLDRRPIVVSVPASMLGAAAIFRYIKQQVGVGIEINSTFWSSTQTTETAKRGWTPLSQPPDIAIVGEGASLVMHEPRRARYRARFPLPPGEQRIISSTKVVEGEIRAKAFNILKWDEFPTTPYLHVRHFAPSINAISDQRLIDIEPSAAIEKYISGERPDEAYVFWSPHWQLLSGILENVRFLENADRKLDYWHHSILMARDEFCEDARMSIIEGLIIDAWIVLSTDTAKVRNIAAEMLKDPSFNKTLSRTCRFDLLKPLWSRKQANKQ